MAMGMPQPQWGKHGILLSNMERSRTTGRWRVVSMVVLQRKLRRRHANKNMHQSRSSKRRRKLLGLNKPELQHPSVSSQRCLRWDERGDMFSSVLEQPPGVPLQCGCNVQRQDGRLPHLAVGVPRFQRRRHRVLLCYVQRDVIFHCGQLAPFRFLFHGK